MKQLHPEHIIQNSNVCMGIDFDLSHTYVYTVYNVKDVDSMYQLMNKLLPYAYQFSWDVIFVSIHSQKLNREILYIVYTHKGKVK